jgi:hypothetical protein
MKSDGPSLFLFQVQAMDIQYQNWSLTSPVHFIIIEIRLETDVRKL